MSVAKRASSGIAGCLAERVPVLHIVGAPSTSLQVSNHVHRPAAPANMFHRLSSLFCTTLLTFLNLSALSLQ